MASNEHKYLGNDVKEFSGFEVLKVNCNKVVLTSDEVTALCPMTGQPDWYKIEITILGGYSLESKGLKLYLNSLRNKGIFCEDLSGKIQREVREAIKATGADANIFVTVTQKPRGGISIEATA